MKRQDWPDVFGFFGIFFAVPNLQTIKIHAPRFLRRTAARILRFENQFCMGYPTAHPRSFSVTAKSFPAAGRFKARRWFIGSAGRFVRQLSPTRSAVRRMGWFATAAFSAQTVKLALYDIKALQKITHPFIFTHMLSLF